MSYDTRLTEECPLTKEKNHRYKLCECFTSSNGLKFIIVCFVVLTFAITTMLVLQIVLDTENISQNRIYGTHGAVATDYSNCSQIGTKILRKSGNAVDAAVAATICMTVVAPHKTGLGGGGYLMIHNYKNHSHPIIIDFANNIVKGFFAKIGVRLPTLLKGLEFAQRLYGNLPWRDIVEPAAKLAREGFVVSKDLADEISRNKNYGMLYGSLNPGDVSQLHKLANTLDTVAEYGAKVLYNGTLSYKIVHNNILHEELLQELMSYKPTTIAIGKSTLHRHTVYYPSRVTLMRMIIETLEKHVPIFMGNASTMESQILIAQTLRRLYLSTLNTSDTQHVTNETYTGVVAMDWQNTHVCILSGLSSPLGSGNMTAAGFLLDKHVINDNNNLFIPIVFHHEEAICGLRGVFGSNDAFLNGQILNSLIIRRLNVSTAVEYPRYSFIPDGIVIENNQRHSMESTALQARLYSIIHLFIDDSLFLKSVNAIIRWKDSLSSHSDSRGNGIASRF